MCRRSICITSTLFHARERKYMPVCLITSFFIVHIVYIYILHCIVCSMYLVFSCRSDFSLIFFCITGGKRKPEWAYLTANIRVPPPLRPGPRGPNRKKTGGGGGKGSGGTHGEYFLKACILPPSLPSYRRVVAVGENMYTAWIFFAGKGFRLVGVLSLNTYCVFGSSVLSSVFSSATCCGVGG